jgi:rhamnulokinase
MHEVHRFANGGVWRGRTFAWDWAALMDGIIAGIAAGVARFPQAESVAIDTWGVDFGLLNATGDLLEDPVHHRDERTTRCADRVAAAMPEPERYRATGIRQMPINTLDQLIALRTERSELLRRAVRLLNVPDLIGYQLTGVAVSERTFASTTSCALPGATGWHRGLLAASGLPAEIFGEIVPAGHVLGPLLPTIADRCRLPRNSPLRIITTASHDTAAAVAAVPAGPGPVCYISSGTWSLMGTLTDAPVISTATYASHLSNEVAWDGRIRLLKNIMGLWILQECRREWHAAGHQRGFAELGALAAAAPDPAAPLDVNDERFLRPGTPADRMVDRIGRWYDNFGLPAPADEGALVRAILDGLAHAYAECLPDLEAVAGQRFERINIIGGGSQDVLLCRLTARACGRPVVAGPVEATALGNLLVQAIGLGWLTPADLPATVAGTAEVRVHAG